MYCILIVQYITTVFLISSYDTPLGQKNFLFSTAQFSLWAVNYNYIVTNSH